MMRVYRFKALISLAILTFVLTISASNSDAKPSGKIKLFTSIPQKIIDDILKAFAVENGDVQVEIFQRSGSGVKSQIELELGSPDGLSADLIWISDPVYLIDLKRANVLSTYKSPEDGSILLGKDANNSYYGARLITVVITYSTDRVFGDDIPVSWNDLLSPRFKDKIAFPDPLKSDTSTDALAALKDKFGWEYFEKLFENGLKVVDNNADVATAILEGKYDVGITLDYMVREKRAGGGPLQLVYPNDGFVVIPSPIGIIRSSRNPVAAKAFMDYILSKQGQEQVVKSGNFLPVRSDVYPPEGAPTIDRVQAEQIPVIWENLNTDLIRIQGRYFDIMKKYKYYTEPED